MHGLHQEEECDFLLLCVFPLFEPKRYTTPDFLNAKKRYFSVYIYR